MNRQFRIAFFSPLAVMAIIAISAVSDAVVRVAYDAKQLYSNAVEFFSPFFAYRPDARESLALDEARRSVAFSVVDKMQEIVMAFRRRALKHDGFVGGQFATS